jgi:predicted ferric reductase
MLSRATKGQIGILALCAITAFPVVGWLLTGSIVGRFSNTFMVQTSIGQLTGLLGIVLFACTLILSARLSFLEDYFGGLDRMYNVHHIMGTFAFILLSIHPIVLATRYLADSPYDAVLFLLPSGDWSKNFGIISFLMLMTLLAVTFYAKWRYQLRKFLHQFLGTAFFIGALHGFMMPSDLSGEVWLMWPIMFLCACGLSAYLYRTVFGRFLVSRFSYTVVAVNRLDASVTEIVMEPMGIEKMEYLPGQFIFVSFKKGGVKSETHPFSISSAPHELQLRITVKALGDYTATLPNLTVGATARIEGPFGSFSYQHVENKKHIWIAGGIGITPFLNMARSLEVNPDAGYVVDFYYSTRTKQEMIFLPELMAIAETYPALRIIPFNADEKGFLSMDVVEQMSEGVDGKDIFVCGPPAMMHSIVAQCGDKGVPAHMIHSEEFKLL